MIAPYNCVVVANGRFPQTALPLHLLHQASVVIACDGAVEALDKAGITPTAIVGDLDSIPSRFREQYAGRFHIVDRKSTRLNSSHTRPSRMPSSA